MNIILIISFLSHLGIAQLDMTNNGNGGGHSRGSGRSSSQGGQAPGLLTDPLKNKKNRKDTPINNHPQTSEFNQHQENIAQTRAHISNLREKKDQAFRKIENNSSRAGIQGKKVLALADSVLDQAESYLNIDKQNETKAAIMTAEQLLLLDLSTSVLPGISWGRDIFEAITGENLITGETLNNFERGIAIFSAVTLGVFKMPLNYLPALKQLAFAYEFAKEVGNGAIVTTIFKQAEKFMNAVPRADDLFPKITRDQIYSLGDNIEQVTEVFEKMRGKIIWTKIWTQGKYKDSIKNAFVHWKNHGNEFPHLRNAIEYVEETYTFVKSPPPGTLTKIRSNGDTVFYHPDTNVFAITDVEGVARTMFKPDPASHKMATNLEYFHAQ